MHSKWMKAHNDYDSHIIMEEIDRRMSTDISVLIGGREFAELSITVPHTLPKCRIAVLGDPRLARLRSLPGGRAAASPPGIQSTIRASHP
jgi:hypothetical protein